MVLERCLAASMAPHGVNCSVGFSSGARVQLIAQRAELGLPQLDEVHG